MAGTHARRAFADQIKAPHPRGWAVSNLALSAFEFKETHVIYGQWDIALRNICWGVDLLVKAHVTASDTPTANVFVGQVCVCVLNSRAALIGLA